MGKCVVVAMSGGVDSSVAAYLLKEQGYDVIGITMQIWQDEEQSELEDQGGCCGLSAVEDARKVASFLGIPYYVLNFKEEFNQKVIQYFIKDYFNGRTPNPCIACNRYVKWEALLKKSMAIGADYIATGHYARIGQKNSRYSIQTSVTAEKDQTYALYNLTQEQLAHTIMPVGEYTKEEIRKIAEKISLEVANKPDSQEICFIADNDYGNFLRQNSDKPICPGEFVDTKGTVLGKHQGIIYYTVGQRKGLGIAFGKPMFVKEINPQTNQVVLGESAEIFSKRFLVEDVNMMARKDVPEKIRALGKIRYSHKGANCFLTQVPEGLLGEFDEPQRAITPGQAAVFYDEDGYILCGGTIAKSI